MICTVKDGLQRLPGQTVLHYMAGAAQLRASDKSPAADAGILLNVHKPTVITFITHFSTSHYFSDFTT
jgi:hypothetical protein